MSTSYKKTTFGTLKRGDLFSPLVRSHFAEGGQGDNDKVEHIPYNAISLRDGRCRTFRDDEKVLITDCPR